MDHWLNKAVDGGACWPKEETTIKFGGYDFILKPATKETEQSIHLNIARKMSDVDGITLMNRFLSVLSWCDDQGMDLMDCVGSSEVIPAPLPKRQRIVGSSFVFPLYHDLPVDPKIRLALALYREGLVVNSIPFSFLSFLKVLNIFWKDKFEGDGENRKNPLIEGIRGNISNICDDRAIERLKQLKQDGLDIAEYLYKTGRCAIAHAYSDPIVDPDDLADLRRLSQDIHIIQAIAAYLIEHVLGVSKSIMGK